MSLKKDQPFPSWSPPAFGFGEQGGASDPMALMTAGAQALGQGAGDLGQDARRGDGRPERGREGAQGPALRRAGMAREPDLRHDPPDLFAGLGPVARNGRRDRGRRSPKRARSCASRRAASSMR